MAFIYSLLIVTIILHKNAMKHNNLLVFLLEPLKLFMLLDSNYQIRTIIKLKISCTNFKVKVMDREEMKAFVQMQNYQSISNIGLSCSKENKVFFF